MWLDILWVSVQRFLCKHSHFWHGPVRSVDNWSVAGSVVEDYIDLYIWTSAISFCDFWLHVHVFILVVPQSCGEVMISFFALLGTRWRIAGYISHSSQLRQKGDIFFVGDMVINDHGFVGFPVRLVLQLPLQALIAGVRLHLKSTTQCLFFCFSWKRAQQKKEIQNQASTLRGADRTHDHPESFGHGIRQVVQEKFARNEDSLRTLWH